MSLVTLIDTNLVNGQLPERLYRHPGRPVRDFQQLSGHLPQVGDDLPEQSDRLAVRLRR
ncbi:MAG: hypothetical protein ACLU9S_16965 [Oscillospiraceae bacterium]